MFVGFLLKIISADAQREFFDHFSGGDSMSSSTSEAASVNDVGVTGGVSIVSGRMVAAEIVAGDEDGWTGAIPSIHARSIG